MRRVLTGLGIVFLVLVLSGLAGVGYGAWVFTRPGPMPDARVIVVARGGEGRAFASLSDAGVFPGDAWTHAIFRIAVQLTRPDGALHAAELNFPAHASMQQVLFVLRHGKPVIHRLTIPEGRSSLQIAALLNDAPALEGTVTPPAEGDVMPLTYDYEWGMARQALLGRMQHAMTRTLSRVWDGRQPDPAIPDPRTLLILASMIERETAVAQERPMVARVFLNRLHQGMRLQSDPSVVYGLNQGAGPLGHALSHADLTTPTAYNTYVISGLPPGPICSPGLASLEAAAHPAEGDMLYFVANGSGGHDFAASLGEHNRHVSAFRARQAAQPEH
ncbi:endolytic transglycosylase MltG [Novacetimonas pomaceti]|uniref:Endolytic murein transglycosylase n=1 Tax=Novacetimonas pomaceti TaxID=2021998 RepID=A0A318QAL1_9PROT|nr:endolytic transglycosylase MltG [Novacetimonas pomaceti]PYD76707.1 aminodeoxychorismate lyase [Novacetimonas pomaceti]